MDRNGDFETFVRTLEKLTLFRYSANLPAAAYALFDYIIRIAGYDHSISIGTVANQKLLLIVQRERLSIPHRNRNQKGGCVQRFYKSAYQIKFRFFTNGTIQRQPYDEFQRVPSILLEMKKIVDQKALDNEDNNGMFWLTGSQKFKMMQDVSESLAGRIAIFDMASLSTAEIEERPATLFHPDLVSIRERLKYSKPKNIHQVYEDIFRGGIPKLRATDLDRDRFYMDYINTYIERDIKNLAQVGKLNEFYDFLVYMAARTGQELKYDEIAGAIGISAPTAKAWVTILERSSRPM